MTCVDVDVDVYRPKLSTLSTFINQIIVHVDYRYDPCKPQGWPRKIPLDGELPPAKKKSAASGYGSMTPAVAAARSALHLPFQQLQQQILRQDEELQ